MKHSSTDPTQIPLQFHVVKKTLQMFKKNKDAENDEAGMKESQNSSIDLNQVPG